MFHIAKAFDIEGKTVDLITLTNRKRAEVKLLNYGAALVELLMPDRAGTLENVVLTYENLEDYIQNSAFFGVTVGRTSGRIADGCFWLDGQPYQLERNFGPNHCHGGAKGFGYRIWSYRIQEAEDGAAVEFEYISPDGEEGYPGELTAKVIYTLKDDNTLTIEYKATTTQKTLCNLTNHSYFNLSGAAKTPVTEQFMKIASKSFLELNGNTIPTGRLMDVEGTPMDFREAKGIGEDIEKPYEQLKLTNGYDHPWILEKDAEQIVLYDSISGRKMSINTTYPCVVVYSFNFPNEQRLNNGRIAKKHDGICFETQCVPNGINSEQFHKAILQLGETYYEKTEFRFSVE